MNSEDYSVAFQLISLAGDAKSSALLAIRAAREGDFSGAEEQLERAELELRKAHRAQTEMLAQEARGEPVPVNIILVHAQDHLTSAMLVRELAGQFIDLFRRTASSTPEELERADK